MKHKLQFIITAAVLLFLSANSLGQAPTLGTTANFVLFSSNGAVSNTGITHLTGNVGANSDLNTGFGNVNGQMHSIDGVTFQCKTDLLSAYNQLNDATATLFPAPLLGNGDTLIAGIYKVFEAATLNLDLTLNAKGNANAVFIFQIQGAFSTGANAKVHLINGALACNVFWKIEGMVNMASGTTMRGTIIANNAAIYMNTGDTLEGRALSTDGAITVDGILAYTPIGCGSPKHVGPLYPELGATECFTLFSSNGEVTNTGISNVIGSVGTNVGLTTGFDYLKVSGTIHSIPDAATAQCTSDLTILYTYLNALPSDIELLYPVQFGNNLTLTPHTYLLDAAAVLTDTLYLDAEGDSNAVFVIQINGALSTSTYAKVILINGTKAKNIFWKVDGAVSINDYSIIKGTIIANNGAVIFTKGVVLDGRALTTVGTLQTDSIKAIMPPGCIVTNIASSNTVGLDNLFAITPNPFHSNLSISIYEKLELNNCELIIYNVLGNQVLATSITNTVSSIETNTLAFGIYFYKLINNNTIIHSGKLISQ